jgi:hypothetical protein
MADGLFCTRSYSASESPSGDDLNLAWVGVTGSEVLLAFRIWEKSFKLPEEVVRLPFPDLPQSTMGAPGAKM